MKISSFEKAVMRIGRLFNLVASASLLAMILLTCTDVTGRYFFGHPLTGVYDLVGLMGAVLVSFSMPYTMLEKGHVAVEILVRHLSARKQLVVETVTHVVAIALFLVLVWQSIILGLDMKAAGQVTPTLMIPFYPIVFCMSVCFFVLCLAIFVNLLRIWFKREAS